MRLFKRAHAIFQASLGPDHEKTKIAASWLQQVKTLAAENETPPVPQARHDILRPGTRVIVQRVRAKPELNGRIGRVVKFDDAKGRYAVKLEDRDDRGIIALKPQNVIQMVEDVRLVDDAGVSRKGTVVGSRLGDDGTQQVLVAVRLSDTGEADKLWIPADRLVLPPGTLVTIVGLNSRRELNGLPATLASWDAAAGRYVVQVSAREKVKLKPGNVTIAC